MNTLEFASPPSRRGGCAGVAPPEGRSWMARQADRRRSAADLTLEPPIEKLTAAVQQLLAAHPPPTRAGPLTIAQAARRLGVSRSRTLLPAIAAGLVATVRWGRRQRVTMEEIERLERQGFGARKRGGRHARQTAAPTSRA